MCEVYTQYYESKGLKRENRSKQIEKTKFYSSEYFSPIDVVTNKRKLTNNTHSIHWYCASWYTPKQKFNNKLKKVINFCTFGLAGKIYNKRKERKNNGR